MINWFKKLMNKESKDYGQLVKDGAIIIDVRTPQEYKNGHIEGSINIPLSDIPRGVNTLNKNKKYITCCASGMRSESARAIMRKNGFDEVHNGRGWSSLKSKI